MRKDDLLPGRVFPVDEIKEFLGLHWRDRLFFWIFASLMEDFVSLKLNNLCSSMSNVVIRAVGRDIEINKESQSSEKK